MASKLTKPQQLFKLLNWVTPSDDKLKLNLDTILDGETFESQLDKELKFDLDYDTEVIPKIDDTLTQTEIQKIMNKSLTMIPFISIDIPLTLQKTMVFVDIETYKFLIENRYISIKRCIDLLKDIITFNFDVLDESLQSNKIVLMLVDKLINNGKESQENLKLLKINLKTILCNNIKIINFMSPQMVEACIKVIEKINSDFQPNEEEQEILEIIIGKEN